MASASSKTYIVEGCKISLEILQDISAALPAPINIVVSLAQRIIILTEAIQTNKDECDLLRKRLLILLPVVVITTKDHSNSSGGRDAIPHDLKQDIERLKSDLESILNKLDDISKRAATTNLVKKVMACLLAKSNADVITKCKDDLSWAIKAFEVATRLKDSVRLCEIGRKVDTILSRGSNALLESLPRAKYASYSCERPDKPSACFEGTRAGIIDLVLDWVHDPGPKAPNIFFMNGIAGVGKTTIARTIAEKMDEAGTLGADLFLSRRGEAELRDPLKVFPTMAYRLAQYDPEFNRVITEALENDPQAPYASLEQQLDRLIVKPLKTLNRDPKRIVAILLDAVDECQQKGISDLLRFLVDAIPSLPYLKVFITGRPENHILSALTPSDHLCTTRLHDIESSIVRSDIRIYLQATLAALPQTLGLDLHNDWFLPHELDLLVEKADNLFIYAVTADRFLSDDYVLDPRGQLDILLSVLQSNKAAPGGTQPFHDLDALYMQVVHNTSSSKNAAVVLNVLQAFLGTIVLLRDPLPLAALEKLAGIPQGQAAARLRHLQSVILPPAHSTDCPRIYHPSFQDFMQDSARCTDPQLFINTPVHEARIALACLTSMITTLPKGALGDLDSSRDTNQLKSKVDPPEIQYSCRFWAAHLMGTAPDSVEIGRVREALEKFVECVLLTWLEAMSLLGETHLAMMCLEDSQTWVAEFSCSRLTSQLLSDAYLLLLSRFSTITEAAMSVTRKAPALSSLPAVSDTEIGGADNSVGSTPQGPSNDGANPLEEDTASVPQSSPGHYCDFFVGQHATFGKVALKRLPITEYNPSRDTSLVRRLEEEVRVWRKLSHPRLLQFIGIYQTRYIFLISPFVQDESLPSYLSRYPLADREQFLVDVESAVKYLHRLDPPCIHGDIRGANILVSSKRRGLLCDFSLPETSDPTRLERQYQSRNRRWQSPEILQGGPRTIASDDWAFGMTIYEVLSGNLPYSQYTLDSDIERAIVRGDRPPQEPLASPSGTGYQALWQKAARCWSADARKWRDKPSQIRYKIPRCFFRHHCKAPLEGMFFLNAVVHSRDAAQKPNLKHYQAARAPPIYSAALSM